jgi:GDPmannose 4,6-dehydratase
VAKRSFITGVNGQDGAYLAQLLLKNGHSVVGAVRNVPTANLGRLQELGITGDVELVDFELQEFGNVLRVIERARADEVYNLAGQSYVGPSFEKPVHTGQVNAIAVTAILEAVRTLDAGIRFYQASTSELFGKAVETPQTERTPFYPRSPYAAAKAYAQWITVNYRESYGMHAVCGILFNHESPLRAQGFVTRKITLGLAQIRHKLLDVLELGNLDARRDWGFAGDYVDGMWRMLQHKPATDYVLATGVTRSIRDFVAEAGRHLGFAIEWQGAGRDERGIDRTTGRVIVRVNPKLFRPAEVDIVCGDASKASRELGWKPHTSFSDMVRMMAEADDRRVREGRVLF